MLYYFYLLTPQIKSLPFAVLNLCAEKETTWLSWGLNLGNVLQLKTCGTLKGCHSIIGERLTSREIKRLAGSNTSGNRFEIS